jgi:gluconolactonase
MSNSIVPIKEFRLDLSDLTYTGHDLVRPDIGEQHFYC